MSEQQTAEKTMIEDVAIAIHAAKIFSRSWDVLISAQRSEYRLMARAAIRALKVDMK